MQQVALTDPVVRNRPKEVVMAGTENTELITYVDSNGIAHTTRGAGTAKRSPHY